MASLRDYLRAAFSAKPIGMFVPPNWLGLAALGLLGALNPGFWLIGAGLELAYLYGLSTNARFRRFIDATSQGQSRQAWRDKLNEMVSQLQMEDQRLYRSLEVRCASILEGQTGEAASVGVAAQSQGLSRLLWIYLRLLLTRESIRRVLDDQAVADLRGRVVPPPIPSERANQPKAVAKDRAQTLQDRLQEVKNRLEKPGLTEELRKSLSSQADILKQRLEGLEQAKQKLSFLEAELTRIQEQIELIREQAALATDPMVVSQRIDAVTETLGDTTQWIREQQRMYGQVEDLLTEPPPIDVSKSARPVQKESQ